MRSQPLRTIATRLPTWLPRRSGIPFNTCVSRRNFTSHDHPPSSPPFGPAETTILSAAYRHVPEHGFSHRSLALGSRDAGYLDISPSVLSDGVFSLIRYHLVSQRLGLLEKSRELFQCNDQDLSGRAVASRVAALTWARLLANKNIIHGWQDALAVMAQPSYVPASLKELALLSDEIWYLAGDRAVDSSWYSKRASLSIIYSTSELFMTNDKSPDFVDTRNFLDRRLDEASTVGGFLGALGAWTDFTLNAGVNVLRSKGARI